MLSDTKNVTVFTENVSSIPGKIGRPCPVSSSPLVLDLGLHWLVVGLGCLWYLLLALLCAVWLL